MMSEIETVEMEVHQLLQGDVDTGLVCLDGADLDELVEANRVLEAVNAALREFVAARDAIQTGDFVTDDELFADQLFAIHHARQRLAAEFGLPLPGVDR